MAANHTPNYGLCQWESSDKVLHTDFNADNRKIDAALTELDKSLSTLTTSLARKLGRSESIDSYKSDGVNINSFTFPVPAVNWSEWEYICALVHYPDTLEVETPLEFYLYVNGQYKLIAPAVTPGYLVVFLPRHNGADPAKGFVCTNRFIPFVLEDSFQTIRQMECGVKKTSIASPNITIFGCK